MHGEFCEFERDFQTLEQRVSSEGVSFLTKTLPALGKAFDLALTGMPLCVANFKKVGRTQLPAFLRVLFRKVFDAAGKLLDSPCVISINDIRQITYLWYKLELPYDVKIQQKVLDRFFDTDQSLRSSSGLLSGLSDLDKAVLATGRSLVSSVFSGSVVVDDHFRPKHGPGAVATGEKPWEKMNFQRYYQRLADVFPYEEHFFLSPTHLVDHLHDFLQWTELETAWSKVVLVPKDSRGPRLIAMEPLELQWIQQGVKAKMYRWIENHRLTAGHVNFEDQTINQRLALLGSIEGEFATLDMKDASDSVSLGLVETLFGNIPGSDLLPALLASRSCHTELPDGRTLKLKKFAPMGSAVCFPVEAIVFWALTCALLHRACGMPLTLAVKSVYVYGDDIIVPSWCAERVMEGFPHFDLHFNVQKSFSTGRFRESCGVDAFAGEDVTPLKIRHLPPKTKTDGQSLTSWVSYSNTLWMKGFYSAAKYCESLIADVFTGIPYGNVKLQGYPCPVYLCRAGWPTNAHLRYRINKRLQRREMLVWTTQSVDEVHSADRWSEVLRVLTLRHEAIRAGRYSVPRKVRTRKRFVTFECGLTPTLPTARRAV